MGRSPPIIITVHGIRTFGQWQNRLRKLIQKENKDAVVLNYGYGYFSVIAFIIPIFRWLAVRSFRRRFRQIIADHPGAEISIVAHSFGTHIVSHTLRGMPSSELPVIPTLVLAGSVLKSSFDFGPLLAAGKLRRVVNDCGIDDNVLLLSQFFILFTGMAGRVGIYGFTGGPLINRYFRGGHSLYFQPEGTDGIDAFMQSRWVPVLARGLPPDECDELETRGPLQGARYALMRVADPVKILGYGLLIWLAAFYGYLEPRRQARLELSRREYQAAATQLTSDNFLPAAVTTLARLVQARAFPTPYEHDKAVDAARFGLQRLMTRDQAFAEVETGQIVRSGTGVYLRGSRVTPTDLKIPRAQFLYPAGHATVVVAQSNPKKEGEDAKAEVIVYDTGSNAELVRKAIDLNGKILAPDFEAQTITGQPRKLLLELVRTEIEGDNADRMFMAIDLDARSAIVFDGGGFGVHANCRDVAWTDDEDKKKIRLAKLTDLFAENFKTTSVNWQSNLLSQYSSEGLKRCGTTLPPFGVSALHFPRAIPEQALLGSTPAPAEMKTDDTIPCAAPSGARGAGIVADRSKLDLSQLAWAPAEATGLSPEMLKGVFEEDAVCLTRLEGPRNSTFVAAMTALGQWVGGWVVCELHDDRLVRNCRVYSFASEGGGALWHARGQRFLIIGDAITETSSTGFTVVDLSDGRLSRPELSPEGAVRSAVVDDERGLVAIAADVVGWQGAAEVLVYDLRGGAVDLVARRRFEPPAGPRSTVPSRDRSNALAPELHQAGKDILLRMPQTLVGLELGDPPGRLEKLRRRWTAAQPGDEGISIRWTVPFAGTGVPRVAIGAGGGVIAGYSGSMVRLILASDGTAVSPAVDVSQVNPNCRGDILQVTVANDDSVEARLAECIVKRTAPVSRDEMLRRASQLDVYLKQLN